MATTTIPWGDGSGQNIYLTYPSATGDQTVSVSSDANTGSVERSKTVTFQTTAGSPTVTQTVVVKQSPSSGPYTGWTEGYRLTTGGVLVADSTAMVSPFFAIPPGNVYLTFDLIDTHTYAPFMALYDANQNYGGYWGPGNGYRTVRLDALSSGITPAFCRFSMRIADKGPEFVRVRDGSFNQQNIWTGPEYYTEYDKVIFGCYQRAAVGNPIESLDNATTIPQDVDTSTTSISFGDNGTYTAEYHYLIMYDGNGRYSNYYTQNANPRVTNDNRWKTTWHKVGKNFEARYIGKVFIKNVTTNTYLFKGKSVE